LLKPRLFHPEVAFYLNLKLLFPFSFY
jgi:hypothetical protein